MEENNKIIAEFMGFNFEKNLGYYDNNMLLSQIIYDQQNGNCFDELLFDKSWDWLMSVVEKILNICAENDDLEKYAVITDNIPYIQQTYDECIKFINFYNKQKEE